MWVAMAVIGLYSVLSPSTRSTLGDVTLLCGVIIAAGGVVVALVKWSKGPRRIFVWIWRRSFGKEITVHPDGSQTTVYLTPTVRRARGIQAAMQPVIDNQSVVITAQFLRASQDSKIGMDVFRRENAAQHTVVAAAIDSLTARVGAAEVGFSDLSERMSAVESALMNRSPN